MSSFQAEYPIRLDVDAVRSQNRLTVFFRLLLAIPHLIVMALLGIAVAVIYLIAWFAILFTGSYPAGMLRFTIGFWRWSVRVMGYYLLLTDSYPPFSLDDEPDFPVRLSVDERIENRNRLTTFWPIRFILAIPHLLILGVLNYAVSVVVIIAWFAALITGSVPAGLHNFLTGYLRWYGRAYGYLYLLVDDYPPFSLN